MLTVQELNTQEKNISWQNSNSDSWDYMSIQSFRVEHPDERIKDSFFDLEILVVQTQDLNGNSFLRVYETLSPTEFTMLLDVKIPVRYTNKQEDIGKNVLNFVVIKPESQTDD